MAFLGTLSSGRLSGSVKKKKKVGREEEEERTERTRESQRDGERERWKSVVAAHMSEDQPPYGQIDYYRGHCSLKMC